MKRIALRNKAWAAVENAARAMNTHSGLYAWGDDDFWMSATSDDALLFWVDDCEARLGADVGNFRSAVLDFIAIRCGGDDIDPADYAQAIQNVSGGAA